MKRDPKFVRQFHIVGGGCYGTQYVKWLLRARSLGMLEFQKIIAIDRNPECRLRKENVCDASLMIEQADWIDYFSNFLLQHYQDPTAEEDHWVPSPLSPHILYEGFLHAANRLKETTFSPLSFQAAVPTPVHIPLESGALAVSFAEWLCPVNCIEPTTCPAIHAPRTWDMKNALQGYFQAQQKFRSVHVLQCQHLVHGVGTIPMREIFFEFKKMLKNLQGKDVQEVIVATTSGCHGLISAASVGAIYELPLQSQTKSNDSHQ